MVLCNSRKANRLLEKLKNGSRLVNNVFSMFLFSQLGILSLVLLTKTKTLYFKISSASCITGRIKILLIVFIFSLLTHLLCNMYAHDYLCDNFKSFLAVLYFCVIILSECNHLLLYDDKICKLRAGTLLQYSVPRFPLGFLGFSLYCCHPSCPWQCMHQSPGQGSAMGGCQVSSGPAESFTHSDSHRRVFASSQGTTLIIEWLSRQSG